jgi:hypothetical protein
MSGSTGVDTSIYDTIKPQGNAPAQPPNPLAIVQGLQGIQKTGLENSQMAQQQAARVAIGQAAQSAIDPETGQLDEGKFNAAVAANPASAFMAQDIQSAQVARNLQRAGIQTADLANAHATMEQFSDQLFSMANKPDLTPQNVYDVAKMFVSHENNGMGGVNLLGARRVVEWIQQNVPPDAKPADLQRAVFGLANTFKTTQDGIAKAIASNTVVNRGGQQDIVNLNANPGALRGNVGDLSGSVIPNTLTPAEATTPREGALPNGAPGAVMTGVLANKMGMGGPISGTLAGQMGQGGAPGQGTGYGGLRPSVAPVNPSSPVPTLGGGASVVPPAQGLGTSGPVQASATTAPTAAAPNPKIFDPQPPPQAKGDLAMQMATGAFQKAPSAYQTEQQGKAADQWQDYTKDLSTSLDQQRDLVNLISQEEQAQKLVKLGPSNASQTAVATAARKLAGWTGVDNDASARLNKFADDLQKAPDTDGSLSAAAMNFLEATQKKIAGAQFTSMFGKGTEGEYDQALQDASYAAKQPEAISGLYNASKRAYEYTQQKLNGANLYERRLLDAKAQPSVSDFVGQWTPHAQATGFGASPVASDAVVAPPGNTKELGQIGPQAAAPSYITKMYKGHMGQFEPLPGGKLRYVGPAPGGQ